LTRPLLSFLVALFLRGLGTLLRHLFLFVAPQ
jgi:hypothetical protein